MSRCHIFFPSLVRRWYEGGHRVSVLEDNPTLHVCATQRYCICCMPPIMKEMRRRIPLAPAWPSLPFPLSSCAGGHNGAMSTTTILDREWNLIFQIALALTSNSLSEPFASRLPGRADAGHVKRCGGRLGGARPRHAAAETAVQRNSVRRRLLEQCGTDRTAPQPIKNASLLTLERRRRRKRQLGLFSHADGLILGQKGRVGPLELGRLLLHFLHCETPHTLSLCISSPRFLCTHVASASPHTATPPRPRPSSLFKN